ncbi:MAG: thioredoxin [Magnetococcales bacterium]|nr:thioredoxin [Magnetococcales bacterium]
MSPSSQGKCGRCHALLPVLAPDCPVPVQESEFPAAVLESPLPVLVDFHATWCGPCRDMAPHFDTVARELTGRLKVVKIDVDASPALSRQFQIQAVPTMILIRDGKAIERWSGGLPIQQLRNWIARSMGWL